MTSTVASPPGATLRDPAQKLIIEPAKGWAHINTREIWRARELIYFLAWREVKVRYQQTALGVAWAILQPIFTMLIFSLFFGRLAKMPSEGVPYSIFAFTALVPWVFFANGLSQASNSIVNSSTLITKVYFPRLVIPISSVLSGLVDFFLAFLLLVGMLFYYGIRPGIHIIYLPVFLLLAVVTCLGVGLWMSALNVRYRDIRQVIPFLTQLWMFGTPIAYPSTLLHEPWRTVYAINPMVGVVEGFRWAVLNARTQPGPMAVVSSFVACLLLISGAYYFRRTEKTFADIV